MEYKENSTKGKALVNPLSYKGDVYVQVWVDSRTLATLSNWLDVEGNYTRYLSEVVKCSLHILCNHLVDQGKVDMIDDTTMARTLLQGKYRINLDSQGRGKRNVLHNTVLTSKRKDITEVSGRFKPDDVYTPIKERLTNTNPKIAALTAEVLRRFEEEDEEKRLANLEAAKRSGIAITGADEVEGTVTTEASNRTDVRGQTKLNEEKLAAYNEGRLAEQRAIYKEKEAKRLKKATGGVSNVGAAATGCVGDQFKEGEEEGDGKGDVGSVVDEVVLKEGEVDLEEVRERSDKRIELENQPVDMSQVEVVDEDEGEGGEK